MPTAEEWIRHLRLEPHPKEGGYFCETYRAQETITSSALPLRYAGDRRASTAIYYLLTPGTCSKMHRLRSDEIFHLYLGGPVRMLQLFPDGSGRTMQLGSNLREGQHLQVVVPQGVWQGSFLEANDGFALLGCTVAPGFEYVDYESGVRRMLMEQYPEFATMIRRLTTDEE